MKFVNNLGITAKITFGFALAVLLVIGFGVVGILNIASLDQTSGLIWMMIIMISLGSAFLILVCTMLTISISRPVIKASDILQEIQKGHLNGRMDMERKDELGKMAAAIDAFSDFMQNLLLNDLRRIGQGDVSMEVQLFDDKDEIGPAMKQMVTSVRRLVNDANMLAQAAIEGQLGTRADASQHQGDFARFIEGINATLDAVIEPVQEAAAVLSEMSNGNLQLRVTGHYQGDNAAIKDALNSTLDSLSGYVAEISAVLTQMANSNLSVEIKDDYRGDFTAIKNALNLIVDRFNTMLSNMHSTADQVAAGSHQVADGSQALSSGAVQQAAAIQQLTSSLAEIAQQTRLNAENANQANTLATTAFRGASGGAGEMIKLQNAMQDINDSSANIAKINKVIDDIAFQTNILALNAAVEAARAGQHGKGFAVVAEEVRNLAARSAIAAQNASELVAASTKAAQTGAAIADETRIGLTQMVKTVGKAAELISEIANAANDQANSINQISQGINQVSHVVQSNSATAEESAATSEELTGQAEILKEMIGQFKLRH